VTGVTFDNDYSPHREPFQYYASTANLMHVRPHSVDTIGHAGDPANHQYDLKDFFDAVHAGNFPAVSFLKAPTIETGHSGESDPLDEQAYLVKVINFLELSKEWDSTAIISAYDDSDGWYDHQMGPIVNSSTGVADFLSGMNTCGDGKHILRGIDRGNEHALARCGYGPRLPMMLISPYAKDNFVDHTLTDQTSIMRFIEDSWLDGKRLRGGSYDELAGSITNMFRFSREHEREEERPRRMVLDPKTGQIIWEGKNPADAPAIETTLQ
jgi:phospholipase C